MGLATAHNTITSKDSLCKWCKATGGWSRAGGFSPTLQCQGFKGHKAPPPPPAAVPSHLTTAMSPTASRKPPCEGVHSSGHPACWSGAGARAREPLGHQSPKGHHVWKQSPQTPTASRDQEKWRISGSAHGFSVLSAFLWKGLRKGRSHCTGGFGTGCLAATQPVTFGGWCWRCSVHLEGVCAAGPGAVCLCWAEPRCPWVSDTAPCSRRWPGGQMPALVGVPVTASRGADQTNQAELCN